MRTITLAGPVLRGRFVLAPGLALAAAGSTAAGENPRGAPPPAAAAREGGRSLAASQSRFPRRERRAFRSGRGDAGAATQLFGRRAAERLELTEEQRDQMRQALRRIADERRDGRRRIADARRSFHLASRDRERTAEEIEALGKALGKAQAEAVLQRRAARERVSEILTEEQRERLAAWREDRQERQRRIPRQRRRGGGR